MTTLNYLIAHSQTIVDFSKFPVQQNDTIILPTNNLLDKINWQAIKSFCKASQGHYAYENNDSLLTSYKYVKQGYEASFEIFSYKGMVMEYYADPGNANQQNSAYYFNKNVWLKYVNEMMPNLPEQFWLTKEEPNNILKAYYRLLGVNTRDEYGFICEYSTFGKATDRRIAVIELLREHRIDLLKRLVEYPNLQTKLYVVDALIYNDYSAKFAIQKFEQSIKQEQQGVEKLRKRDSDKIEVLESQIKILYDSISYYNKDLLTNNEWKMIYNLRDSNLIVNTCGNAGSYKIYETPISELLSDKALADIPKKYEALKKLGYFR